METICTDPLKGGCRDNDSLGLLRERQGNKLKDAFATLTGNHYQDLKYAF